MARDGMRTPVPVALAGPEAHELPEASRGLTVSQGESLSLRQTKMVYVCVDHFSLLKEKATENPY